MDLTKRIELYFGKSPVKGDITEMQSHLDKEREFCAVYFQNDLPAEVHNRTNDHMLQRFGSLSKFVEEGKGYVRPYQVSKKTGLATVGVIDGNANSFRNSGFGVGGTFFGMEIAEIVLKEFENLGYKIDRRYE